MFLFALVVLAGLFVVPTIAQGLRGGQVGLDRSRWLLTLAVRNLPPDRLDWGEAMLGEFDHVQGRRARWRFSLGCAWAGGRLRVRAPEPGGAWLRAVVFGCVSLSVSLVGYRLRQEPRPHSQPELLG